MKSAEEIYVVSLLLVAAGTNINNTKDPIKYIKENLDTLLSDENISYVHSNISLPSKDAKVKADDIIAFLVRDYIQNNYDQDNFLIKYLMNNPAEAVYTFFKENIHFSKEIILSFFNNIGNEKKITNDQSYSLILKFEPNIKVEFLASILRRAFNVLYSAVSSVAGLPCSTVEMFLLAMKGHALIGGNKQIEESIEVLKSNYPYLIRLMYADVYEDLASNNLLTQEGRKITQIVTKAINEDNYVLPSSEEDMKILFSHFNYLAESNEKRVNNRKSLGKDQLEGLKKINPMWMLDESDVTIKR